MEPGEYLEVATRITRDGVYFGDEKLPGVIEAGGIVMRPGSDCNRLTVTFLVGEVEAVDPIAEETTVDWPALESARYKHRMRFNCLDCEKEVETADHGGQYDCAECGGSRLR